MIERSVVVHGHFYQPPREDPWTGEMPEEMSAAPDHDWNVRITRECYAPLAGPERSLGRGVSNLYKALSFDVCATLFEWLERCAPSVYTAILMADRSSARKFGGHGNAIAAPYHHVILPLATRRDKVTEVRWGIRDFTKRFGRAPEGMWLPETAVDEETLDVLAEHGIRFTMLAPHQVENPPVDGLPLVHHTSGGRSISLFIYDGAAAADIAFAAPLTDESGAALASRLTPGADRIVMSVATDGETFGHHHKLGVSALRHALAHLRVHPHTRVENFSSILARTMVSHEARLRPNTSWSCSHGIERWRGNCGCRVHAESSGDQQWRAPLRDAMNWLAAQLHETFEREGVKYFDDPWAARDAYDGTGVAGRARELLEMERFALRMFTSCAWFFDEVRGLEVQLVVKMALRAIELSQNGDLRSEFLARLPS